MLEPILVLIWLAITIYQCGLLLQSRKAHKRLNAKFKEIEDELDKLLNWMKTTQKIKAN